MNNSRYVCSCSAVGGKNVKQIKCKNSKKIRVLSDRKSRNKHGSRKKKEKKLVSCMKTNRFLPALFVWPSEACVEYACYANFNCNKNKSEFLV